MAQMKTAAHHERAEGCFQILPIAEPMSSANTAFLSVAACVTAVISAFTLAAVVARTTFGITNALFARACVAATNTRGLRSTLGHRAVSNGQCTNQSEYG